MSSVKMQLWERSRYAGISFQQAEGANVLPDFAKLLTQPKDVIVNCGGMSILADEIQESLGFVQQQIKANGKKLTLIYVSEALRKSIQDSKFLPGVPISPDLSNALEHSTKQTLSSTKLRLVRGVVNATLRSLLVDYKLTCHRERISFKPEDEGLLPGDYSAAFRLEDDTYQLAILSVPQGTLEGMIAKGGKKPGSLEDTFRSLAGAIAGQVQGCSVPEICLGREWTGLDLGGGSRAIYGAGQTIVVPFRCDAGQFFVEAWFPDGLDLDLI